MRPFNRAAYLESLRVKPLADIPNAYNFRFIGVTKTGLEIRCIVKRDLQGSFYAVDENTLLPCFKQLKGWR